MGMSVGNLGRITIRDKGTTDAHIEMDVWNHTEIKFGMKTSGRGGGFEVADKGREN